MIIIYAGIVGFLLMLIIAARNITIPKEWNVKKEMILFYKASILFYERLERLFKIQFIKPSKRARDNLAELYYVSNHAEVFQIYQIQKSSIILFLLLIGTCVGILAECSNYSSVNLSREDEISRNVYGGGKKVIQLEASAEQEKKEAVEVEIWEKQFTEKELNAMWIPFTDSLEQIVKGGNADLAQIDKALNLCSEVEGFPFQIEWDTSSTDFIQIDGSLKNEPIENETIENRKRQCVITAEVTYLDWKRSYTLSLKIVPPLEEETQWQQRLTKEIQRKEENSREQEKILLPSTIEGKPIQWKEVKKENSLGIFILMVAAVIAVYQGKDMDLQKRAEERKKQMLSDYPELVSKLSLLVSTGMTIPMAWRKIAMDYQCKREKENKAHSYVYEEMLLTCYEMDSGISQIRALENFGKRCKLQKFKRLTSLLIQNMKKGSAGLITILKEEVKEAFEERKNIAKRLGEEASTKLLLPMTLMLLVVMIIIMIPAFLSFTAF